MVLKKTKLKSERKTFSLITILKSSAKFALLFKRTFIICCVINFFFLFAFKQIPNGWTNSLSIIWLVAYYIYWCVFIRFIQQHPPYFSIIRIFNGIIPTSKIMFINVIISFVIIAWPYVPLLMGFREKYLEFFEKYMEIMQSCDSLPGKTLFYIFMFIVSPWTLSRPYLAWIASLIGKSRSIIEAYEKTRGNYWNFMLCAAVMGSILAFSYFIDTTYKINTHICLMSIFPVYFNIVFIEIYKIFYKKRTRI